jgi:predicted amidohydrolase
MKQELAISLLQLDLYWEDIDANLAQFEEQIWQLSGKSDVIVLPEMFTTGFTMRPEVVSEPMNGKTFKWLKQIAAQQDAMVIASYVIKENQQYYNRLFAVRPDGSFEKYDKRHLFIGGEDHHYTAGKDRLIIEWRDWKIMPLICYDLRFPVFSRSQRKGDLDYEYDLLVYIANWPAARVFAWTTLLQARAIENQAYCVGVNRIGLGGNQLDYTGHSAIYDYLGREISHLEAKPKIETITLDKNEMAEFRDKFPFQKDSDGFNIHF